MEPTPDSGCDVGSIALTHMPIHCGHLRWSANTAKTTSAGAGHSIDAVDFTGALSKYDISCGSRFPIQILASMTYAPPVHRFSTCDLGETRHAYPMGGAPAPYQNVDSFAHQTCHSFLMCRRHTRTHRMSGLYVVAALTSTIAAWACLRVRLIVVVSGRHRKLVPVRAVSQP